MQDWRRVHLPLFMANVFYGINFTTAKVLCPSYIQPFGFIVIRVACAGFLFLLLHLLFIRKRIDTSDLPKFLLCAVFGVVLNQLLFFKGISLTTPIHGALIMITTPVLVLVMLRFINKEKINPAKNIGIALALIGAVVLMILGKDRTAIGSNTLLGDICVMINASCYAIYLVIVKPLMQKYHPITVVAVLFAMALPLVSIVGWHEFAVIPWSAFYSNLWWCLASVVIGATFFAYLLNTMALQYASAAIVGAYIFTQPIIAGAIAIVFFHEQLTWVKILAAIFIFIGVSLVSKEYKVKS